MSHLLKRHAHWSYLVCLLSALAWVLTWGSAPVSAGRDCGLVNFNAAPTFAAGPAPNFVAAGDFNGDGRPDLAVSNGGFGLAGTRDIAIMLGEGGGNFRVTERLKIPTPYPPSFIAAADFNGDGRSDMAVTTGEYADLYIFLSQAAGFGQPSAIALGVKPKQVAAADFNGDSKRDLAVVNSESNSISILLGDGAGGFAPPKNVDVYAPEGIDVGDFNDDGKTDIVEGARVLLGDGAGNFNVLPRVFPSGSDVVKAAEMVKAFLDSAEYRNRFAQ
jgi:hypothetical protein